MPPERIAQLVDLGGTLLTALLASFHCAGMCGGFALAATAGQPLAGSQALYHLGKSVVYIAIGAVAGLAGVRIGAGGQGWHAVRWLALLAGGGMIAVGAAATGLLPRRRRRVTVERAPLDGGGGSLATLLARAAAYRGPLRALVLGTLSALLPCPLVYAFAAKAAASGSVPAAMATMAALGLGSMPILVAIAASGRLLPLRLRARMVRLSGILMILLGAYTIWRGFAHLACCGVQGGAA